MQNGKYASSGSPARRPPWALTRRGIFNAATQPLPVAGRDTVLTQQGRERRARSFVSVEKLPILVL
jgi:hypothetical protein